VDQCSIGRCAALAIPDTNSFDFSSLTRLAPFKWSQLTGMPIIIDMPAHNWGIQQQGYASDADGRPSCLADKQVESAGCSARRDRVGQTVSAKSQNLASAQVKYIRSKLF
jgi:hypothetical protein